MTSAADISAAKPADWARSLYERQIAISGELAEDGLEISKALKAEILAAPADEATQATVMAYGRAARSVRLSVMLQARLVGDLEAWDRGPHGPSALGDASRVPLYRIERIIIAPADGEGEDADRPERLTGEACERLDQEDFRRFGEPIALIRRDVAPGAQLNSSPIGGGGDERPVRSTGIKSTASIFARNADAQASAGRSGGGGKTHPPQFPESPLHQTSLRSSGPPPPTGEEFKAPPPS